MEHLNLRNNYSLDLLFHDLRVAKISYAIGKSMGLSNNELNNLYNDGLIHDIGKSMVPINILYKSDKLTKNEWYVMKKHPIYSEQIYLSQMNNFNAIEHGKIIRHHHENYDGSGYPDGLKGNKIPLFSRIITIADVYDSITNIRVYRNYIIAKPIEEIEKDVGTKFDESIYKYAYTILKQIEKRK